MSEYERYRLQWMLDHDHSLTELIRELNDYQNEADDMELTVQDVFNEWERDTGFGGELWVCEEEFEYYGC